MGTEVVFVDQVVAESAVGRVAEWAVPTGEDTG